jgi:hypothetical protein
MALDFSEFKPSEVAAPPVVQKGGARRRKTGRKMRKSRKRVNVSRRRR